VQPVSVEHKLGIHASPTCVMGFGDNGGAHGWLVGEENKGLACMFTMVNLARLSVGLQGVAIAERATQAAVAYAHERKQMGHVIADYPDVKRAIRLPNEHGQSDFLDMFGRSAPSGNFPPSKME
jgi:butyryl-CoA dehydrogenase